MHCSRRALLSNGVSLAGASLAGVSLLGWSTTLSAAESEVRHIAFTNLHTGEHVEVDYFRDGDYRSDALTQIEKVLRDFRNGEQHPMDPKLMDYLLEVAAKVGAKPSFQVISGYRSPQTNEKLHAKSSGVSEHSLHMQGRAIDVRMAGVDCAALAASALELKRGGVGYYRASNFVHLDTGAFRTWRG
jgi:uncharacterized protein YcbK (DUF882 family)